MSIEQKLKAVLAKVNRVAAFDAPELHNFSCWDEKLIRALLNFIADINDERDEDRELDPE